MLPSSSRLACPMSLVGPWAAADNANKKNMINQGLGRRRPNGDRRWQDEGVGQTVLAARMETPERVTMRRPRSWPCAHAPTVLFGRILIFPNEVNWLL